MAVPAQPPCCVAVRSPHRLLLVGATGYTGELVARELIAAGAPFTAVGRDASRLQAAFRGGAAAPMIAADIEDPADVDKLITPDALIVNCVGPFGLRARVLARMVAERGATYVDVTGEEPFVAFSRANLDDLARNTGALLVHACAFESFPADLLACQICDPAAAYADIASYYRVPVSAVSPGTRLTARLAARGGTSTYDRGTFVPRGPGSFSRDVVLPFAGEARVAVFAPYPEVRFWPARYHTRSAASFLLLRPAEAALVGAGPAKPRRSVAAIVAHEARRRRPGPTEEQRRGHEFAVGVVATGEDGRRELATLTGRDPYGLTAAIAARASLELLGNAGAGLSGVRSPAEVFDPVSLHRLVAEDHGVRFNLGLARQVLPSSLG